MEETAYDGPVVWVRRQWNDWRHAKYRLQDFDNPHWTDISGGVMATAPQPFIHGYVRCDGMLEGELAHSCAHGEGPHRILVCVTKVDNTAAVFKQLEAQAGPKPTHKRKAQKALAAK